MKYMKIMDIKPDMILARSLLNKSGDIFLEQNAKIRSDIIQRLKEENYSGAYIYDDFSSEISIKENVPIDRVISAIQSMRKVNIDECGFISGKIVKLLETADSVCAIITSMASYDSYTYTHSINVATYAGTFGMLSGFDANKVKNLTLAELLHDIGKTMISERIIQKSDKSG